VKQPLHTPVLARGVRQGLGEYGLDPLVVEEETVNCFRRLYFSRTWAKRFDDAQGSLAGWLYRRGRKHGYRAWQNRERQKGRPHLQTNGSVPELGTLADGLAELLDEFRLLLSHRAWLLLEVRLGRSTEALPDWGARHVRRLEKEIYECYVKLRAREREAPEAAALRETNTTDHADYTTQQGASPRLAGVQ
jgi:hypothetical protein